MSYLIHALYDRGPGLRYYEAFKGRGNGDFLVSHDLDDIVTGSQLLHTTQQHLPPLRPALVCRLPGRPQDLWVSFRQDFNHAPA